MPSAFELFGEISVDTGGFRSNIRAADSELKNFEKSLSSTESKAKALGSSVSNAIKPDRALQSALADILKMQGRTAKGEADLTALITKQADQQTRIKIGAYQRQTQGVLAELKKHQAAERKSIGGVGGGIGSSFASGLGVPVGLASVGLIAAAGVGAGISASITAAKDAANAQIQLQSIAKETGLVYADLAKQATEFGNAAGRSDKIDEFRKKFIDLAAAKGIDPSKLGTIAQQLNQLVDEATDRLLNANPSAFYDAYAKSVNKTADSLTDAEKRAAVFDEVLRRGAIFDGAASSSARTLAGDVDSLRKNIEDVTEAAGKALGPLASFLAGVFRGCHYSQRMVHVAANPRLYDDNFFSTSASLSG